MGRALVLCGRTANLTPLPWPIQNHGYRNEAYLPGQKSRVLTFQRGTNRRFAVLCNMSEPGASSPSPPPSNSGNKWMLGMILSVVVPFVTTRGGPLRKIENEIKMRVKTVENLVEEVEEVAEDVEKLAGKIAEDLPAGRGQLKTALQGIEDAAKKIEEEAELIEDLVDKIWLGRREYTFLNRNLFILIEYVCC